MPKVLTINANIQCGHAGNYVFLPGTGKIKIDANEIVTESMLAAATIAGCTNTVLPETP